MSCYSLPPYPTPPPRNLPIFTNIPYYIQWHATTYDKTDSSRDRNLRQAGSTKPGLIFVITSDPPFMEWHRSIVCLRMNEISIISCSFSTKLT